MDNNSKKKLEDSLSANIDGYKKISIGNTSDKKEALAILAIESRILKEAESSELEKEKQVNDKIDSREKFNFEKEKFLHSKDIDSKKLELEKEKQVNDKIDSREKFNFEKEKFLHSKDIDSKKLELEERKTRILKRQDSEKLKMERSKIDVEILKLDIEQGKLKSEMEIEHMKMDLEVEKLKLETEKLDLEKRRDKKSRSERIVNGIFEVAKITVPIIANLVLSRGILKYLYLDDGMIPPSLKDYFRPIK